MLMNLHPFWILLSRYKLFKKSLPSPCGIRSHPSFRQAYISKHFYKKSYSILLFLRGIAFLSFRLSKSFLYLFRFNNLWPNISRSESLFLSSPNDDIIVSRRHFSSFTILPSDLYICANRTNSLSLPTNFSIPNYITILPGENFLVEFVGSLITLFLCCDVVFGFFSSCNSFKSIFWDLYIICSSGVQSSLRYSIFTFLVCSRSSISHIYFTYENHSWEHQVAHLIRSMLPSIHLHAYLFAGCCPDQFHLKKTYFRQLPSGVDFIFSNNIFFSGFSELNSHDSNLSRPLSIVNCPSPCKQVDYTRQPLKPHPTILFAPQDFDSEIEIFFDLFIKLSRSSLPFDILFRFHPSTDPHTINYLYRQYPNLVDRIDTNPLGDTLSTCSFLIYRGSSVSITAIDYPVIPLYYNIGPNIDPLFHILSSSRYFSSFSELSSKTLISNSCFYDLLDLFRYSLYS